MAPQIHGQAGVAQRAAATPASASACRDLTGRVAVRQCEMAVSWNWKGDCRPAALMRWWRTGPGRSAPHCTVDKAAQVKFFLCKKKHICIKKEHILALLD